MARGPIPDFPQDRPTIPEVEPLIIRYYSRSKNFNGGTLHVVLEDGNLGPGIISSCAYNAAAAGDHQAVRIACAMLQMTPTQRRKLYRRSGWVFIGPSLVKWRGLL